MQRSPRQFLFFIATLIVVAMAWPSDAFAQRGQGHGGGARGATAVSRGGGGGPAGGQVGHGQTAVPRQHPPPGSYGGHYGHYHGYYGYGWGFYGGFYYPPFYSMWGWYPYPFGYPWYPYWGGPYWGGPYWGPYDNSASVRLQVTPREAEVYVDGYYAGVVDDFDGTFQRLRVGPGGHQITIWREGYRSATEQMYFRPTGSYKVSQTLEKLAAGQPNDPKPQPKPGARPSHDRGDEYGPPPEGEGEPGPGARRPEPHWPDPVEGGAPRTVPPGEPRVSGQSASFGTLAIRVQPEGAAVTVDGERWQGPATQDRLVLQLAGGRHHVEIQKDGYVSYSSDVEVRPGESTALNVSLPPTERK